MRRFIFSFIVIIFVFSACGSAAAKTTTEKAKAVLQYYVKNTRGIILKGDDKVIKGRIRGFRGKGIVFDPAKSGPFYNPKPQYYPMSRVQAFVDAGGKVLWGHTTVKPTQDYMKIRRYKANVGLQYGYGRHQRSYTFSPIAPEGYDYVQQLQAGSNIAAKAAYFVTPKTSIGVKYMRHHTAASLYGLQVENSGGGPALGTINDDILIQNFLFAVDFFHAVSRRIIFHAGVGIGVLSYKNNRTATSGAMTISNSVASALPSAGFDFLLHRNVAVTVDIDMLFGSIKNPDVSDKSPVFTGQQSMNRFDVNIGVAFFF